MKAALVAAGAALLVMTAAASAQEAEGDKKEVKKVERIIVLSDASDADKEEIRERVLKIHKIGEGKGDHHVVLTDCDGEKAEIVDGDGEDRTRIVICGESNLTPEQHAAKLEELRQRLASRDHLSVDEQARFNAAIDHAIARLRRQD
jgi:Spy/CpxP family protein refolding chaperone